MATTEASYDSASFCKEREGVKGRRGEGIPPDRKLWPASLGRKGDRFCHCLIKGRNSPRERPRRKEEKQEKKANAGSLRRYVKTQRRRNPPIPVSTVHSLVVTYRPPIRGLGKLERGRGSSSRVAASPFDDRSFLFFKFIWV